MSDDIIQVGNSLLQHGKLNDRVYIMKLEPEDIDAILAEAEDLAVRHRYSKIFAKAPQSTTPDFRSRGYTQEAAIPAPTPAQDGWVFMSLFLTAEREEPRATHEIMEVQAATQTATRHAPTLEDLPHDYRFNIADGSDCVALAALYDQVFPSYPFPIADPGFLRTNMETHVRYYLIHRGDQLVAASSAEMDREHGLVEMTDFATLPSHRGKRLAQILLTEMDRDMTGEAFTTAFTIARAVSFGMNLTFARGDYEFGGTLRNNTQISGTIESMNIWYKHLLNNQNKSGVSNE